MTSLIYFNIHLCDSARCDEFVCVLLFLVGWVWVMWELSCILMTKINENKIVEILNTNNTSESEDSAFFRTRSTHLNSRWKYAEKLFLLIFLLFEKRAEFCRILNRQVDSEFLSLFEGLNRFLRRLTTSSCSPPPLFFSLSLFTA